MLKSQGKGLLRVILGLMVGFLSSLNVNAAQYHGRLNLGVFASKEKFAEASGGSSSNDSLLYSGRFFLDVSSLTAADLETVIDLRDKYDAFGRVLEKDYTLEPKNEYQARQLALKYPNSQGTVYGAIGRFPAMDAGINYVDGGELGIRIGRFLRLGIFGGYDPAAAKAYGLAFSQKNKISGAYGVFQSSGFKLTKNFYSATAFITEEIDTSDMELSSSPAASSGGAGDNPLPPETIQNQYLYNNTTFQLLGLNTLNFVLYYDTKPEKLLRHLWVSDQSELLDWLNLLLAYAKVDYKDPQIAFATLSQEDAKVEEYSGRIKIKLPRSYSINLRGMQGKRFIDDKKKSDYAVGLSSQNFLSKLIGLNLLAGKRERYTYREQYYSYEIGYFSASWELLLNQEFGKKTSDDYATSSPMTSELGLSNYWSKTLFSTLAVQHQKNEDVGIVSALFRIGYRFGNREIPPIRDGAPPMGGL